LLTKRRQDLVAMRTQTINRLHRLLLVDLVPGGARHNLTAKRAAALLAGVTPAGAPAVTRWQLATELAADVRQLEQRIAAVEARIKAAVAQANTACSNCSAWDQSWPPPSWARSATFAGSPASTTSPPTPGPPRWRPPAARWCGIGCPGPEPQAEPRAVPDGDGAGPPAHRRAGLLPAQASRGQVPQGGAALSGRRLSDAVDRCLLADQTRHSGAAVGTG
jgi:outer membrane murein-binding lipoprotein Lpp